MEKREKKNFRINDSISNVLEYLDEKKKSKIFLTNFIHYQYE